LYACPLNQPVSPQEQTRMPSVVSKSLLIPGVLMTLVCLSGCQGHRGGSFTGPSYSAPGYVMLPGPTQSAVPQSRPQSMAPREQYWQTPSPFYAEPVQAPSVNSEQPVLPVPAPPAEDFLQTAAYPQAPGGGYSRLTPVPDYSLNSGQFGHAPPSQSQNGEERILRVTPPPRRRLLPRPTAVPNFVGSIGRGLRNGYYRIRYGNGHRSRSSQQHWPEYSASSVYSTLEPTPAPAAEANEPRSLPEFSSEDLTAEHSAPHPWARPIHDDRNSRVPSANYGELETVVPRPVNAASRNALRQPKQVPAPAPIAEGDRRPEIAQTPVERRASTAEASEISPPRKLPSHPAPARLEHEDVLPQVEPRRSGTSRPQEPARVTLPASASPIPSPNGKPTEPKAATPVRQAPPQEKLDESSPGPMLFVP
jgi:hypothetical protein